MNPALAALARVFGIAVEYLDLGPAGGFKGALIWAARKIVINVNCDPADREYTLAHELGHFFNGRSEVAADRFADSILSGGGLGVPGADVPSRVPAPPLTSRAAMEGNV